MKQVKNYLRFRFITIVVLLFSVNFIYAQDSNIQISLDEPVYGVKIKNNFPGATRGFSRTFMLSNQDASVNFIGLGAYGTAINGVSTLTHGFLGPSYDKPFMAFLPNGNIGIGTTAPKAKLDVIGGVAIQSLLTNTSSRPLVSSIKIPGEIRGYSLTSDQADDGFLRLSAGAGTNPSVLSYIDISSYSTLPDMNMNIIIGTNGTERMRISAAGNVSIGTNDAKGYKLAVAGNMIAESVKVKLQGVWPDYVFTENHILPTLEETEKHIKEKGHLPGMPSAEEVKKKGLDLGEMNAKLFEKIEEMTLRMIELNKAVKKQQKMISEQQIQINNLKKK